MQINLNMLGESGIDLSYEAGTMVHIYFKDDENAYYDISVTVNKDGVSAKTLLTFNEKAYEGEFSFIFKPSLADQERKRMIKTSMSFSIINASSQIRPVPLLWGAMTGIRPAKIISDYVRGGLSYDEAEDVVRCIYKPSEEKLRLIKAVAKNQEHILCANNDNTISVYIGIPFCPSRCSYCSFVSSDMRYSRKYMARFVELLIQEIKASADIVKTWGKKIQTIYVGGGTPTSLEEHELDTLLSSICSEFDISDLDEFTVEAGRADTITKRKLEIIKSYDVDRISINPQTMNDEILSLIGRKHNSDDVERAFYMAREIGFDNINMDIIAGLPEESFPMYSRSLDRVVSLNPENITMHSLSIKRAAALNRDDSVVLSKHKLIEAMIQQTYSQMCVNGYVPYYMYRQKNTIGNMENVGYSKEGYFGIYNINIMEENQSILALGGGASSKIIDKKTNKIDRVFNFKDPVEYIRRFDEIIAKKHEVLALAMQNN